MCVKRPQEQKAIGTGIASRGINTPLLPRCCATVYAAAAWLVRLLPSSFSQSLSQFSGVLRRSRLIFQDSQHPSEKHGFRVVNRKVSLTGRLKPGG